MSLRVLHLTTVASPIAGAELTSLLLARELRAQGVEFEVCTISPSGDLHRRLSDFGGAGSALGAAGPSGALRGAVRVARRIRSFRPDLIHAQLFHAGILGAIASRAAGLPYVLTRQYVNSVQWYRGRWAVEADAWAARQADTVIAISNDVRRFLEDESGIAPSRIRLVHNAADVDRYLARPRVDVSGVGDDGEVRLVYVASLHARKGHVHLLEAIKLLRERGKKVRVFLVGDGGERAALTSIVERDGIRDEVVFMGWRDDVDAVFATAHVYVHSALEEAFGIAIAEAMAAHLPVVATRVGGIPDVVAEGETGLLVPAADGRALADALALLIDDPAMRARMGAAGRQRAIDFFAPKPLARRYAEVFRETMGQRAGAAAVA